MAEMHGETQEQVDYDEIIRDLFQRGIMNEPIPEVRLKQLKMINWQEK